MSLIVGLHNSKKVICFSNGYAALKCGVSTRTITDTLKKFVEEGYIRSDIRPDRRIIHLIKQPILINDVEDCGIETGSTPVELTSTPHRTEFHTPTNQVLTPIEATSNNNIDNNIVDSSYGATPQPYPKLFVELYEKYEEDMGNLERAFKVFKTLSTEDITKAIGNIEKYFLYYQSRGSIKKELYWYLKDRVWEWNNVKYFKAKPKVKTEAEKEQEKIEYFINLMKNPNE